MHSKQISLRLAQAFALVVATFVSQSTQAQTFTVLHNFTGGIDGSYPMAGLTIDRNGNLYGTTFTGGNTANCNLYYIGCGTVFRLAPKNSSWIFTSLYEFLGGNDGKLPDAGVVLGPDGSLYGTTQEGGSNSCGNGCGTVFNLRPPPRACTTALCPWTETVIHSFSGQPDGAGPYYGDVVFDQAGNLYGTTLGGGTGGWGTVYRLTPFSGSWTESILYNFTGQADGGQPYAGVIFNRAGNLYGTTFYGGAGYGLVYQLAPSGGAWQESILHTFQGNDGGWPYAGLIFDNFGHLYGANSISQDSGGEYGGGTVYELNPSDGSWTLNTLYSFNGAEPGPYASLVMDAAGNLYGTTRQYENGYGEVFKMVPNGNNWVYVILHEFSGSDGADPVSNVVFDSAGNMYGTTSAGGTGSCNQGVSPGCGVVWEITP